MSVCLTTYVLHVHIWADVTILEFEDENYFYIENQSNNNNHQKEYRHSDTIPLIWSSNMQKASVFSLLLFA